MNRVRLYYINHRGKDDLAKIDGKQAEQWLSELSLIKRESVKRLLNKDDQLTSLLALRLLKECVCDEDIMGFRLHDIDYPKTGKPKWQSSQGSVIDFNISHSDKCILVAVGVGVKVGVDVERVRELTNLNFKMVMTPDELQNIRQTPKLFFELWSKKESVVKAADTKGLSRMRDVKLEGELAELDGASWHLKNIKMNADLNDQYEAYLASSEQIDELTIKSILIENLTRNTKND